MTLKDFFDNDRFAVGNGVKLIEFGEGRAIAEMQIEEKHLNGTGTVQGGALFTLADLAFAAAANSRGKMAVSLDANISFIKAVSSGKLTAIASEIYLRRTVAGYKVDITAENGELVAVFNSTAYRKEQEPKKTDIL